MKTKPIKSGSLASRINFALISRKFFKNLVIDLITVCLILFAWCAIVERSSAHGEKISHRYFGGSLSSTEEIGENLSNLTEELKSDRDGTLTPEEIEVVKSYLPFSGINYCFTSEKQTYKIPDTSVNDNTTTELSKDNISAVTTKHEVSAAVILTLVCVIFIILFVLQFIEFIVGSVSGSGVIRKYLRPIDDIAMMAEQLSVQESSVARDTVSAEVKKDEDSSHDDTDITTKELSSLSYAIDSIDDSCKRIEIHDTELSGIEAAVNNMLRRLEEGKRKQIRFVDDASHELRTPIAVIQGYVNMLDRWGKDDPAVREEAIAAIKNESEHMKVLIDQLLFLARGEMDRHVLDMKPLNSCSIMEETYDESIMLEAELPEEKRHEFDASELYEDDALKKYMISADEAMIKQAVRILRDNAMKYTPAGGTISFRSYRREDGKICMEVRDTGIGIPKSELPRIFDRFYRGTNARADNTSGSGLGLSIAKWIAESHGGAIEALSGSGFGTKMTIVLEEKGD
jgi:histidine kinase